MDLNQPTETILSLLKSGQGYADEATATKNATMAEKLARRAIGYFDAAQVLLAAFGELHNGLVERPEFITARHFCRAWRR